MIVFRLANSLNMVQMDQFKHAVAIGYLEQALPHCQGPGGTTTAGGSLPAVGWRRSSNFGDFLRLLRPDKEDVARNKREEQERRGDRRVYSHEEYIGLVLRSGSMISHFYVICVCVGRGV